MVSGEAKELSCKVRFTLKNGSVFTLNSSDTINQYNYLSAIKLNEELSAENNIPVGVNSSSVLDLEVISNNKALIPENEDSVYYGYMDDSAILELIVTENSTDVYMGKYYVDSWKSNITSDTPNKVVISATCIMGIITKQDVPDVMINSGMFIKDYIIALIEELNLVLASDRQIHYRSADINFDTFPTMQFSNLDTENMSNCLNGLSQCTLTNIYSDRQGYIKTDYCCDDSAQEAEYSISVMTSAEAGSGVLVNYDGIKVNYSLGNILDVEQLAGLYQQSVIAGNNTFRDIALGQAVYKINRIEVEAEDKSIFVSVNTALTKYNKNKMTVVIEADAPTKVDIRIYGQRLDDTSLVYEVTGKNELEVNNKVIGSPYIEKYAQNMIQLINFKNNSMTVAGYFTPKIKLGDIVYINCINSMSISGYYKVVRLEWDLSAYGKCNMSVIKTFDVTYDIDAIMADLNDPLERTIAARFPRNSEYVDLSTPENDYANTVLETELETLRLLEYGEV